MAVDNQERIPQIENINAGYVVIRDAKNAFQSGDTRQAFRQIGALQNTRALIENNLPTVSKKTPNGFYSPTHMMANAMKLAEQVAKQQDSKEVHKGVTATDQAMRLMSAGTYEKERKVHDALGGGIRYRKFQLSNLVEIPAKWKQTQEGKDFLNTFKSFVDRRKQGAAVDKSDAESVNKMMQLTSRSYQDIRVPQEKQDQAPFARELILINLELLRLEVDAHMGKQMPPIPERIDLLRLIRGLYNYNEEAEMEHQIRPSAQYVGLPEVVEQPRQLKT